MADIYSSAEIYRVARALASVAAADTPPRAMAAALAYAFGGGAGLEMDAPCAETPRQRLWREMRDCRKRLTEEQGR
jgi:hypothetical protein